MDTVYQTPIGSSEVTQWDQAVLRRFRKTLQLIRAERSLTKSCSSVVLLNDQIRGLTKRYVNAEEQKSLRYSVRLRLAIAEGVRDMFYEYARKQADDIAELRKELYNQSVEIVGGRVHGGAYDDDSSDDYDEDDADDDFGR